jgi:hypothetical protein
MKYIRLFEEVNIGKPEIGDWIICKSFTRKTPLQIFDDKDAQLNQFLSTNIGKIVSADSVKTNPPGWDYEIFYEDAPDWLIDTFFHPIGISKEEISYWSKDKEELEYIISANKYNL